MKLFALMTTLFLTLTTAWSGEHRTVRNCDINIYAVSAGDTIACDGSYNQFCGHRKYFKVTLGVYTDRLDDKVKRVGFKGTADRSGASFEWTVEADADKEYRNGLWDLDLTTVYDIMGENKTSYRGAFFVETESGTYYWLKRNFDVDYEFNESSSTTLSDYRNRCY